MSRISFLLSIAAVLGIGVWYVLMQVETPASLAQEDELSSEAPADAGGTSVLYIRPDAVTFTSLDVGARSTAQVRITPGADDAITAVSLELVYDSELVTLHEINTSESPLSVVLLAPTINNKISRAQLAIGVPVQQPPLTVHNDALVATITYTARSTLQEAPFALADTSVAAAIGKRGNVVNERVPAAERSR